MLMVRLVSLVSLVLVVSDLGDLGDRKKGDLYIQLDQTWVARLRFTFMCLLRTADDWIYAKAMALAKF